MDAQRQALLEALAWDAPVFTVSAATGDGTDALAGAIMSWLDANPLEPQSDSVASAEVLPETREAAGLPGLDDEQ